MQQPFSPLFSQARRGRTPQLAFALVLAFCIGVCALVAPTPAYAWGTNHAQLKAVGEGKATDGTYSDCIVSDGGTRIKLTRDVTLNDYWYITTTSRIVIDLNGHKLNRNLSEAKRWGCVVYMCKGARLSVEDSSQSKTGEICGGYSSNSSGGVYCESNCRLTLNGGAVINNNTTWGGGGIYLDSGSYLYLSDGSRIQFNRSSGSYGGGVYADRDSRIYMNGGLISHNTADGKDGGGIYAYRAVCYIYGGEIYYNSSYRNGGGVYLEKSGATVSSEYGFFVSGDAQTISNYASGYGGGVYLNEQSDLSLSGRASVTNNAAVSGGGGIYAEGGKNSQLCVSGTPTVTGNKVNYILNNLEVKATSSANLFRVNGTPNLSEGAEIGLSTKWTESNSLVFVSDDCAEGKNTWFRTKYFPSDDSAWEFLVQRSYYDDPGPGVEAQWVDGRVYAHKIGDKSSIRPWTRVELYDNLGHAIDGEVVTALNNSLTVYVPEGTDITQMWAYFPGWYSGNVWLLSSYGGSKTLCKRYTSFDFTSPKLFYFSDSSSFAGAVLREAEVVYEVTVKFIETPKYSVKVTGEHATVTGSVDAVKAGTALDLSVSSVDDGYEFTGWEVVSGGAKLSSYYTWATSFTMPASDVVIRAKTELKKYGVFVGYDSYCFATPGSTVTVTATPPSADKRFAGWKVVQGLSEDLPATNPVSFTMPANSVNLEPVWEDATYKASVTNGIIAKEGDTDVSSEGKTSGDYAAGTALTLRPDEAPKGKVFSQWKITAGGQTYYSGTDELEFTVAALDVAFEAEYVDAPVGEYSVDVQGGSGSGNYAVGETVTITANDLPGYEFDKWEVVNGDAGLADTTARTTTFTMPSNDVVVKATYKEERKSYVLIVENGTATVDGTTVASGNEVQAGKSITLTANTAATGHSFDHWELTWTGHDKPATLAGETVTVTMPSADMTAKAVYRVNTHYLTVENAAGAASDYYDYGTQVSLTAAEAPEGYVFDKWEATGLSLGPEEAKATTLVFAMPDGDVSVKATYKQADYTLTVIKGKVKDGGATTTFHKGDEVELVADDVSGKTFAGWNLVSGTAEPKAGASNTFVLGAGDVEIEALYTGGEHTVSVSVSPVDATGCSVLGDGTYTAGEEVTLCALEDDAHKFSSWSGLPTGAVAEGSAGINTVTFTMPDADVEVTANFEAVAKYQVTVNGNSHGYHMPGDKVTVFADAPNFKDWAGTEGLTDFSWHVSDPGGAIVATFTMPAQDVALTTSYWSAVESIDITMADTKNPASQVVVSANDGEDDGEANKYVLANVNTWDSTGTGGTTNITFNVNINSDAWPNLRFGEGLAAKVNGRRAVVALAESGSSAATVTVEFLNSAPRLERVDVAEVPEVANATTLESMVENGTLPAFATLVTDGGDFQAAVNWDLASASPAYDPSSAEKQVFTISGTFELPEGIDNPEGISTTVTVQVTVLAKAAPKPTPGPVTPSPATPDSGGSGAGGSGGANDSRAGDNSTGAAKQLPQIGDETPTVAAAGLSLAAIAALAVARVFKRENR